jgi:hypothetical protein
MATPAEEEESGLCSCGLTTKSGESARSSLMDELGREVLLLITSWSDEVPLVDARLGPWRVAIRGVSMD